MYIPNTFSELNQRKLHEFIERHCFATLVSQDAGQAVATHLPLVLQADEGANGRLLGHLAKANPQWKAAAGQSVLAFFQGPDAYVSPTWYGEPNVVPTWNYVAVHVYGTLRLIDDRTELERLLGDMVERFEHEMPAPWSFGGSPEFFERQMQMIVGFTIDISRIEGKWKLSQNQSPQRRQRVMQALLDSDDPKARDVARLMQERES